MAARVTAYKGFKIHEESATMFKVYTADEWAYGKGFRYPEWEAGTMQEAKEFIDCY